MYKLFWCGNPLAQNRVGIMVSSDLRKNVIEVRGVDARMIIVVIAIANEAF